MILGFTIWQISILVLLDPQKMLLSTPHPTTIYSKPSHKIAISTGFVDCRHRLWIHIYSQVFVSSCRGLNLCNLFILIIRGYFCMVETFMAHSILCPCRAVLLLWHLINSTLRTGRRWFSCCLSQLVGLWTILFIHPALCFIFLSSLCHFFIVA